MSRRRCWPTPGWESFRASGRRAPDPNSHRGSDQLGSDAELQNIHALNEWQGRGIGTRLLGVITHRLAADGSRSMCVGYDSESPYRRFYLKHGAVETSPGALWPIRHDDPALASRLPAQPELMTDLAGQPRWLRPGLFRG